MTLSEIEAALRAIRPDFEYEDYADVNMGTIAELADALKAERERIDRWASEIDQALRLYEDKP